MSRNDSQWSPAARYVAVAALASAVFLSAYSYAAYRAHASGAVLGAPTVSAPVTAAVALGSPGSTVGCACCSNGSTQAAVVGIARMSGGIQRISVDTASGSWAPNEIRVRAGVPIEIAFAQGTGCLARVTFDEFGIAKDLTRGGAVVKLPALKPGEYVFSCGMRMALGKVVAK